MRIRFCIVCFVVTPPPLSIVKVKEADRELVLRRIASNKLGLRKRIGAGEKKEFTAPSQYALRVWSARCGYKRDESVLRQGVRKKERVCMVTDGEGRMAKVRLRGPQHVPQNHQQIKQ